jgi:hypothetical protein
MQHYGSLHTNCGHHIVTHSSSKVYKFIRVLNYTLHHKDLWRSGDIAPWINLGTRRMSEVNFTPRAFYTRRKVTVLIVFEAGEHIVTNLAGNV